MPAILNNPHVALNNARNLPRNPKPIIVGQAVAAATLPSKRAATGAVALQTTKAEKARLVAFIKARQKRAECDEFIAQNKADVFEILGKIPGGNFTQSNAMIYRADSISYQYSPATIEMERDLATRKKIEQTDGRAFKLVKGCVKFENLD